MRTGAFAALRRLRMTPRRWSLRCKPGTSSATSAPSSPSARAAHSRRRPIPSAASARPPDERDATSTLMAVAGEEQRLVGSRYFAEQAKQKNRDIEAMFTNDIDGAGKDPRVRVFSEGVPSNETPEQANTRRSVGGENDSASRQLARFIAESAAKYVKNFGVWMIYRRDRYLRGGDHIPFLVRG